MKCLSAVLGRYFRRVAQGNFLILPCLLSFCSNWPSPSCFTICGKKNMVIMLSFLTKQSSWTRMLILSREQQEKENVNQTVFVISLSVLHCRLQVFPALRKKMHISWSMDWPGSKGQGFLDSSDTPACGLWQNPPEQDLMLCNWLQLEIKTDPPPMPVEALAAHRQSFLDPYDWIFIYLLIWFIPCPLCHTSQWTNSMWKWSIYLFILIFVSHPFPATSG